MASKTIILSDISGAELTDENHARLVVRHPDISFPVSLDVSSDESAKLTNTTLRLVEFDIFEPNQRPRKATLETKQLDKLFGADVNFDDVLASAPKADQPSTPAAPRKRAASSGAVTDRIDYTSPENAGKLHRGRITDAEKEWVKANQSKASANRKAQTGKDIDFSDPSEVKRYGL